MTRRAIFIASILIVAAGALAFRLPRLDLRPLHGDEAVNAFKAGTLFDRGEHRYDPHEYHGPTLYYGTLPCLWLSGAKSFAESTEAAYRLVPVACGVGLILLLLLVGDGLGRPAAIVAGVLTAVSPAMVFYSRYYIHEMLLVFFTFAAIAAGWRYAWSRKAGWAVAAGAALGLMFATKETWVFAFAAMGLAIVAKLGWRRWWGYPINVRAVVKGRHLALAGGVGLVVSFVLFSSFFTNWRGPLDSVLAYANYLKRSDGAGLHDHPWNYYLRMLLFTQNARGPWWSEALIMALAAVGFVAVMWRGSVPGATTPLARFIAFYTLFLTAIYALIPYKTPWCLLGFLQGMTLLAGVGAVVLVRLVPTHALKAVAVLLLAAGGWQLASQAYRASFRFCVDRRNPYVYAHTSPDLLNVAKRAEEMATVSPEGHDLVIKVISPEMDYWPLPWYLRRFRRVGYWNAPPDAPDAPMLIASADVQEALDKKLHETYERQIFGLRPTVHLVVYIREDLWREFIRKQQEKAGIRVSLKRLPLPPPAP